MQNKFNPEIINTFLNGRDPMDRVVNIECGYGDNKVKLIYKNNLENKCVKYESFYPFLWAKRSACLSLCGGDREKIKSLLSKYNISVKPLTNKGDNPLIPERMDSGYTFMFYATRPMPYNVFLKFFEEAKNPVYNNRKDKNGVQIVESNEKQRQYLSVTPVEQFMIQTGKRLFKGYDDYDDLLRLTIDLETTGLTPSIDRITKIGIRSNKGYENIITVTEESELDGIISLLKIIKEINPDIITGHNIENFDSDFLITRVDKLIDFSKYNVEEKDIVKGRGMIELSLKIFGTPLRKKQKKTVLKLGGETEYFNQTELSGYYITDSLHAVRRAQAIDSNIQKADLKYVANYSKIKKPNRVYIPGDKIKVLEADKKNQYAFDDSNGSWYLITESNPIKDGYEITTGQYIVDRYLSDDLFEGDGVELRYNQSNFLLCKLLPTTFSRACTMGTAGTWKMIMLAWSYENNIAIPNYGKSARFTGGLSRLLSVGYVSRVVKLDYNSLYPAIILSWDIATELDVTGVMLNLLDFILTEREKYKDLKGVASKNAKKGKEQLINFSGSDEELLALKAEIQKYEFDAASNDKKQLPFKIFGNSFFGGFGAPDLFNWGDLRCAEMTTCIGRQSLRLVNKWFKNIGYSAIVMDTDGVNFQYPEQLRYTVETPYIGKGLNRNTIEGKTYCGVEGDVAEFNDLFMRKKMGLGIDEYAPATINFSRKNYADLLDGGKVKLVGNTIKSKKMPGYIEKFLQKAINLLLNNNGPEFITEYYNYIEKIYNFKIPLRDIASRGRIKRSIEDYITDTRTLTKAGRPKSRQAWYELAMKEGLSVNIGDTIYYVNTGTQKSHSDVKKKTYKYIIDENNNKNEVSKIIDKEYKEYKKTSVNPLSKQEFTVNNYPNLQTEEEITLCSCIVPNDIIESEYDVYCDEKNEYNVSKYIAQFNKRITPLLVCFPLDIRNKILIENPKDRQYFTENECTLCSGQPNKVSDQDTYEQLMVLEDKEIKYWLSINQTPTFANECGFNWDEIVDDYHKRLEKIKELGLQNTIEKYEQALNELTEDDVNDFIEDGLLPQSILDIVKEDPTTNNLLDKNFDYIIGNINDILDIDFNKDFDN